MQSLWLILSIGIRNDSIAVIQCAVLAGIWQVNSHSPKPSRLILERHRCRKLRELRMWNRFYCWYDICTYKNNNNNNNIISKHWVGLLNIEIFLSHMLIVAWYLLTYKILHFIEWDALKMSALLGEWMNCDLCPFKL